jgi:hypothetical protein
VERSRGKIRADVAHQRLVAMGHMGSERTTRRAVADAKRRWRAEHGRRTRPWVVEPGLWMQWDYGDGPVVAGRSTVLFCAWLAWSRFRVVLALWDKTTPSVVMALDRALRTFGGAPTYALTDNEKTSSSASVMWAETPGLEASLTKAGSGAWSRTITGQAASCTIFSIGPSAWSELSPSPTSATSGRSRAVTAPMSATSISRAITSCPQGDHDRSHKGQAILALDGLLSGYRGPAEPPGDARERDGPAPDLRPSACAAYCYGRWFGSLSLRRLGQRLDLTL